MALLAVAATACSGFLSAGAAVVNGHSISQEALTEEVDLAIRSQQLGSGGSERLTIERQSLVQLIQKEIVRAEAAHRGVTAPQARVDEEYANIQKQFPSVQAFKTKIDSLGLTEESLKERVAAQILVEGLGAKLAGPVADAAIRSVYLREVDRYRQVKIRHILFVPGQTESDAKAKAEAVAELAKLKAGESFAGAAKKLSMDPMSRSTGGLIQGGLISLSDLGATYGAALAAAALKAKIGVPTGPVRGQYGYSLILVEVRKTQPFVAVAAAIRAQLEKQAGDQALGDFISRELATAKIVVNPRFGDWDPSTEAITEHQFFIPGVQPTTSENPAMPAGHEGMPGMDMGGSTSPHGGTSGSTSPHG